MHTSGLLFFEDGQSEARIKVEIMNANGPLDDDEHFKVVLSDPQGVSNALLGLLCKDGFDRLTASLIAPLIASLIDCVMA